MSNLVRRITRNSRGELQLEEADQVDTSAPADSAGFSDSTGTYDVTTNNQTVRFARPRRYTPELSPPPPSPSWLADHGYVRHIDTTSQMRMRAIANHRAWSEVHDKATGPVIAWLASEGLLGDDAKDAFAAHQRGATAKAEARQAIDDAKAAANAAAEQLARDIGEYLPTGKGGLPDGHTVVAAKTAVEGYELVAAQVDEAAAAAFQRWGRCIDRADWAEALRRAGQLRDDQAKTATTWLKAKTDPGPGPGEDPNRWL